MSKKPSDKYSKQRKQEIVDAVTRWTCDPTDMDKSMNERDLRLKAIWAGLIKEFLPEMQLIELAGYAGQKSHSTVHGWLERWKAMPWTTRYSWLEFMMGSDNKKMLMVHLANDPAFRHQKGV